MIQKETIHSFGRYNMPKARVDQECLIYTNGPTYKTGWYSVLEACLSISAVFF